MDDQEKTREELLLELKTLRQKHSSLEQKVNEASLADEWKLRGLFEKGPMAVAYHVMVNDESGKPVDYLFLDANDQYVKLTGVDPRGKNATEAFPGLENDPFNWIGVFGNVARTGETIRFEQHLEPNQRWYDCIAFQYKPDHFVVAFFEITARKKAENALAKSEVRMGKMLANIGDVIVIVDQQGINRYKSPNLKKWFGWKPEELVGLGAVEVVHPDDREKVLEFMDDLSKIPNMKGAIECRYQCKDGNYKWIEIVVTNLIHDPDIQGFLGNYHDITEHKNAEETLLKLKEKAEESDQLKSAFLANMSHEIRTPLNGIIGFIDLLQNPDLAENQRKQFAGLIKTSSDRLLTTITDIIAISKIESGQCELHSGQVDISALVHNLVDTYRFQLENRLVSLHVSQSIEADFRYIISDKMKLETILRHFINNAIKFTEKGSIEIGVKEKDEQIILYVFDTGIGISEDKKEIIFERFVQAQTGYEREYEGSGLGLSIAKAYAVLLGAKIWVESVVNKGSTFYLSVSRKVAVKQNSATGQVSIPVNKEAVMVLVVEDDKVSYLLLKEVLHNNGFVVKHAVNGLEAVKFMKDNPQTDIVLMDVKMPVMDGIEATIQIRQFNQDVPIIAQTAYALAEEMEKMERVGCNDYLTKPINSEVLLNCINENLYLAESRSR